MTTYDLLPEHIRELLDCFKEPDRVVIMKNINKYVVFSEVDGIVLLNANNLLKLVKKELGWPVLRVPTGKKAPKYYKIIIR